VARVGKPRCVRILAITAGSSMAARRVKGPPHWGQVVRSMAKTRLSNCAQLIRARVEGGRDSPAPSVALGQLHWVRSGTSGPHWGPARS